MVLAPHRIDVEIEYCAPCEYLPQAVDLAHRLLFDFQGYVKELRLVPGSYGVFNVSIGGEQVFKGSDSFPNAEEIKGAFRRRLEALTGQVA